MARWCVGLLATLAALALMPSAAYAGTVDLAPDVDGSTLVFFGDPEANHVRVAPTGATSLRISDELQPVTTENPDCQQDGDHAVICFGPDVQGVSITLGGGDDVVLGVVGPAWIHGGAGDDRLLGSTEADTLDGGADADDVDALGGPDTVTGGAGPDDLVGGDGIDRLSYAGHPDDVEVDLAAQTSQGDGDTIASFENVTAGDGSDRLVGGSGVNLIDGGPGDDEVVGGDGDDALTGGPGLNRLDGGGGNDTVDEHWSRGDMNGDLSQGFLNSSSGDGAFIDSLSEIENAQTGPGSDAVSGDAGPNRIQTADGNDVVTGGGGSDVVETGFGSDSLQGEGGDDDLNAGDGADVLLGGTDQDVLRPGKNHWDESFGMGDVHDSDGPDQVDGGSGTDRVDYVDRGHDVVVDLSVVDGNGEPARFGLPAENDRIERVEDAATGSGADVVRGSTGPNVLATGRGSDRVDARDGTADAIDCGDDGDVAIVDLADSTTACETEERTAPGPTGPAGPITDTDGDAVPDEVDQCPQQPGAPPSGCPSALRVATDGNDLLSGDNLANVICGLGGADRIRGMGGNDTLWGDACGDRAKAVAAGVTTEGNDTLFGDDGDDKLFGAGGSDRLKGGRGNDRLVGGDGNDRLWGDAGRDRLAGGRGNDTLTGGRQANRYTGGAGNDVVRARNRTRDMVDCGSGRRDVATVDRRDRVKGCEKVKRAPR